MAALTFNKLVIEVNWTATPGSNGGQGVYEVTALNLRVPQWWGRRWKLFRAERPQFQSAIEEMRWAVDELHTRLHGGSWVMDDDALMELIG